MSNFEYQTDNYIFKSIGNIEVVGNNKNKYEFSQIYIDTIKKEILGTDIKSYINDESFKIDKRNKPRIFANTFKMSERNTEFAKSIFTLCDYRKRINVHLGLFKLQKCFTTVRKNIYYDNAVVKVFDLPIFYLPKLSHRPLLKEDLVS